MNNPKIRRLLILLHLYAAAFMAPAFVLVAITGGLHIAGDGEAVVSSPLRIAEGATIDYKSNTIDDDVRALLKASNIDHKFEYVKVRGSSLQLRPTSRPYIEIRKSGDDLSATLIKPNFQKAMMEIHKGHGPMKLRKYHILVAISLFFVIFGGILVGLLAKAYRKKTITALGLGFVLYFVLANFA